MEEPILHEQTRISPIMLSMIVHSALVLFFIIEMNRSDITPLPSSREAEVIMMPQEQQLPGQPMTQTALTPTAEEVLPEEKNPENVLENFPSFKQLPSGTDITDNDEQELQANTEEITSVQNESEREAEELTSALADYEDSASFPTEEEAIPVELPTFAPQQWPTSVVQDAEPAKTDKPTVKKTTEKLQAPTQKKLSLADIGKKYQEYLYEERVSNAKNVGGVTILGNNDLVATGDHIKHARFMEKLSAQVQKAWSRNRHLMHNPGEFTAEYSIVLNKDGSIRTFKLRKSCGNKEIDDFIVKVYYDASSSFPPIPDNFKLDSYGFNIIVTLYPYVDQGPLKFSSSWN